MLGLVVLILFMALPAISLAYGVDSRDDSTDPRRPASPVDIR
jgi:hypothetical protein